jgi:nitrite reductase (NADH) small subunit/3-phenylpropionate/trans-cinnamate dioxygenase ferredoxin subunit
VARASDVPARGALRVEVEGVPVAVWRVGDAFYAMEDRCPHAGHALHDGALRGCVVVCPQHGWDFDLRTGFRPGNADGWPIPCFRVVVEGDELSLETPAWNLPRRRGP